MKKNNMTMLDQCAYGYIRVWEYFDYLVEIGKIKYTGGEREGHVNYGAKWGLYYPGKDKVTEPSKKFKKFKHYDMDKDLISGCSDTTEYLYKGEISYIYRADGDFYPMRCGQYDHYGKVEMEVVERRKELKEGGFVQHPSKKPGVGWYYTSEKGGYFGEKDSPDYYFRELIKCGEYSTQIREAGQEWPGWERNVPADLNIYKEGKHGNYGN